MSDVRWKVRLSPTGEVRRVDDAGLADLLRDPLLPRPTPAGHRAGDGGLMIPAGTGTSGADAVITVAYVAALCFILWLLLR